LNGYSQSAVEEDKAEIYAALMRAPAALLDDSGTTDLVIRAKAREIKRRMEWSCGDINEEFWNRLRQHTPHPQRPLHNSSAGGGAGNGTSSSNGTTNGGGGGATVAAAAFDSSTIAHQQQASSPSQQSPPPAEEWVSMLTHEGHAYWFNRTTKQTSWIAPQWTHAAKHHHQTTATPTPLEQQPQ
jgi:hypothetical protein